MLGRLTETKREGRGGFAERLSKETRPCDALSGPLYEPLCGPLSEPLYEPLCGPLSKPL